MPLPVQTELVPEELGRSRRKKRPTWKVLQQLQELTPPPDEPSAPDAPILEEPPPTDFVRKTFKTPKDSFGLYREYSERPSHSPDDHNAPTDLTNTPLSTQSSSTESSDSPLPGPSSRSDVSPILKLPSQSSTVTGLLQWMWTGSPLKSLQEFRKLLDFLRSDSFHKEDLKDINFQTETAKLDAWLRTSSLDLSTTNGSSIEHASPKDGWREVEVKIQVPDREPCTSAAEIPLFRVPGLHLRSLVEVIKSAFSDPTSHSFHYIPFRKFWSPPAAEGPAPPDERIHDEIYSSDAMIEEHINIQKLPAENDGGQYLERVVVALMFWSDSTHLASFGNASLWPIYLFFGNQSKYTRAQPHSTACHHVAYIPKVRSFAIQAQKLS